MDLEICCRSGQMVPGQIQSVSSPPIMAKEPGLRAMKVTPIIGSKFRSDGGANFGLVPKKIWARLIEPDESNLIPQCAHCLLVELDDGRVGLIDTGIGDPSEFSDRERKFNGLEQDDWELMDALARNQIDPGDIHFVILTHLHWDHAGGTGRKTKKDGWELTFPNAQHFVHGIEWDDATSSDPLLGNAYPQERIAALIESRLDSVILVTDEAPDILPGIRLARSGGHTEGHCVAVLTAKEIEINHPSAGDFGDVGTIVFPADVCPTAAHLRMLYQLGFDTYPLATRLWKHENLAEIADEGYLLIFDHDPARIGGTIRRDPGKEYLLDRELPLVADA